MEHAAADIIRTLRGAGHEAWFVGGCVRDALLGLPLKDIDIATDCRPEAIARLFPKTRLVGAKFGVVLVRSGEFDIEVATFRRDGRYLDHRHPESVAYGTMADDAARRDFTINALYRDPDSGDVRDLVGGLADIAARRVRCVGDPRHRFEEDALRMLRAVRFAARLGFEIEAATWDAMKDLAPAIQYISAERHREELTRILTGPSAGRGLRLMLQSGLLHWLLPEAEALDGVEQGREYHPEGDVFTHTCLVLDRMEPKTPVTAWAALLHDIAKPATFHRDPETRRISFHDHERIGADMAREILDRFRASNDEIEAVAAIVRRHMMFKDLHRMRRSTLRQFLGAPTIEQDFAMHRADILGSNGDLSAYEFAKAKLAEFAAEPPLPAKLLNGRDVMALGVPPGPRIGALIAESFERQLEGEFPDRDAALAWLRERVQAG